MIEANDVTGKGAISVDSERNATKARDIIDWFESVLDALDAENQLLKELLRYAAPSVDHSTCLDPRPYAECKRCEIEKAAQNDPQAADLAGERRKSK